MSIIHMDGFDSYTNLADLGMEYAVNGGGFSTTGGRFGGGAFHIGGYNNFFTKTLPAPLTELWLGGAFNFASSGCNGTIFVFNSASGRESSLCFTGGQLVACRGDLMNNPLGSVAFAPSSTAWHWIEVHFKLHGSAGIFEVWLDGNVVSGLNLTGINTKGQGGSTVSSILFGSTYAGNGFDAWCDDWYILDPNTSPNTGRLGDSRIRTLTPTSDVDPTHNPTGPNSGTPDTGSTHYTQVNEAQWSSAHNVTLANKSGQEELYGMGSLGMTPSAITAVRVMALAEKSDAGEFNLETVMLSGSTEADGPTVPVLTSYAHILGIFEVDPATSAAWTASGVNAMKCGCKVP